MDTEYEILINSDQMHIDFDVVGRRLATRLVFYTNVMTAFHKVRPDRIIIKTSHCNFALKTLIACSNLWDNVTIKLRNDLENTIVTFAYSDKKLKSKSSTVLFKYKYIEE